MSADDDKNIIEIWKTVVEVQQHFNDIEMRIRSIFVTILLALFASIGFLMDKKVNLHLGPVTIAFATLAPSIGIIGTYLFYFIDRYWYHRLLVGAVKHGIAIERKYGERFPDLSLSDAIGKESPIKPSWITQLIASLVVTDVRYKETGMLHSDAKIEIFYKSIALLLFVLQVLLLVLGGISIGYESVL